MEAQTRTLRNQEPDELLVSCLGRNVTFNGGGNNMMRLLYESHVELNIAGRVDPRRDDEFLVCVGTVAPNRRRAGPWSLAVLPCEFAVLPCEFAVFPVGKPGICDLYIHMSLIVLPGDFWVHVRTRYHVFLTNIAIEQTLCELRLPSMQCDS